MSIHISIVPALITIFHVANDLVLLKFNPVILNRYVFSGNYSTVPDTPQQFQIHLNSSRYTSTVPDTRAGNLYLFIDEEEGFAL